MTETRHAFQLIHTEILEEQKQVCFRVEDVSCLLFVILLPLSQSHTNLFVLSLISVERFGHF